MLSTHLENVATLAMLDFSGKGEAFVEARFITPLLDCLGYETHQDYEVARHGDNAASFKLHYPPVEKGAGKVKHYNPDYIPTIRKKAFWVIEAKAPGVPYPFEAKYLVQGLQYCIHPEIQAKYLLVTSGTHSAVYDAHGAVFMEQDIYEPVFQFKSSELAQRWNEIYELLSVETLRGRIEVGLKAMYDKLCLSSLDSTYPQNLLRTIGVSARGNSQKIQKHVNKLYVAGLDTRTAAWQAEMDSADPSAIFARMDTPIGTGACEANYFVTKGLAAGKTAADLISQVSADFDRQSIFRKEQSFVALCSLHQLTDDAQIKEQSGQFLERYKEADLPLINNVECAQLRVTRKLLVISIYPEIMKRIEMELKSAPELIRFVSKPTSLGLLYPVEVYEHHKMFESFKALSDIELDERLHYYLKVEATIEGEYKEARAKLADSEKQICDLADYGIGGKHYAFKNIMHNFRIA
jgi:hypothetical protein